MVMILVIMVMMLVMFLIMVLIMMLVGIRRMFSITMETVLVPPVPIVSPTLTLKLRAGPNPTPTTVIPRPIRFAVDLRRYLSWQLYNDLLCLQGDALEVSQKGQTNYKPFHRFTENLKSKKSNKIAGRLLAYGHPQKPKNRQSMTLPFERPRHSGGEMRYPHRIHFSKVKWDPSPRSAFNPAELVTSNNAKEISFLQLDSVRTYLPPTLRPRTWEFRNHPGRCRSSV
jgi:hypothetical protein